MTETYTPQQHQYLIDEAKRAARDGDPIRTLNALLQQTFPGIDDRNRDYISQEFMTWFDAFGGEHE